MYSISLLLFDNLCFSTDTSDEDEVQDDAAGLGSESDDHWEELSDFGDDDEDGDGGDNEDVEMSD